MTPRALALIAAGLLAGCASHPPQMLPPTVPPAPDGADAAPLAPPADIALIPDAVPRTEPRSRYGNGPTYTALGQTYQVMGDARGHVERGIASWYGTKFHGQLTSSREPYDMYAMTAAHKSLPLPSYVRVTHLQNGRSIVVRVNDRGPFKDTRIIDLSYAAAAKLGMLGTGTAPVEIRVLDTQGPAPLPTPAQPVRLYVQAGAFSVRANAERLREQIQTRGAQPVRIDPVTQDGRALFRVRIGPVLTVDDADRVAELISPLGVHPQVVID